MRATEIDPALVDALVQALRTELTPLLCGDGDDQPCVYQDPIRYEQLELCRLGYE